MSHRLRFVSLSIAVACGGPEPLSESTGEIIHCAPDDLDCTPEPDPDICPSVASAPPTTLATYHCDAQLRDEYERGVGGATITLASEWCNRNGTVTQSSITGLTSANGVVRVSGSMRRGNRLTCFVTTTNATSNTSVLRKQNAAITTGTVLSLDVHKIPSPTASRTVTGRVAGSGRMDLYQSGAYDKVLIVPEHFDTRENDPSRRRNREQLWTTLQALMENRFDAGWDIWLFQPRHTGDNLHEQAAELAQAIQWAATGYAGAPACGGGQVTVFGLNTGGVVGRLATARWEADAGWRSALGLADVLPVNALGTGDSPHYGWNIPVDMQSTLWSESSDQDVHETTNLDSCAAVQLLRRAVSGSSGSVSNIGHVNFFELGNPVAVYSRGSTIICDAGPALASLNWWAGTPGWPAGPFKFGYSNGHPSNTNSCTGEPGDLNSSGQNVCKYIGDFGGTSYTPSAGDAFVRITIDNWPDRYWDAREDDLLPGSRSPILMDGYAGSSTWGPFGGAIRFRQRFSPTMIPSRSADGTERVNGGSGGSPFDDFSYHTENGVADMAYPLNSLTIINNLNAAGACPPSSPLPDIGSPGGTLGR
jgi:hypothetical protein